MKGRNNGHGTQTSGLRREALGPPRAAHSLDQGDPHWNARRLGPLRRMVIDQVLDHRVLGHMFHQIRLGCVRSPAHAAAVRLGVFHGVGGQVDLEGGGVCVRPVAVRTLVGFVFVVLPLVRLQVGQLCEGLFTAGLRALIGPIPSVNPGVLLEMRQLSEGFLAVRAVIGLHAQVDAQVLGEV